MAPTPSVLIIGSEAVPFAKTGGLADVLGALPAALGRLGWDVTLALPRYHGVAAGTLVERFPVTVGGYTRDIKFFEAPVGENARAILVDCPDLFDREALYGVSNVDYADNARRFAMLVRAALEYAGRLGSGPSIVHAHDWQAGLAPVYLKTLYATHPVLGETPSVLTIHNLAYQGLVEADWLPRLDLGWDQFTIDGMEFYGRISLLKGGINDAEIITTVSRTYAAEIQTPELGFGFDGILRRRTADLFGILNGIDTNEWDPSRDRFLPKPYTIDRIEDGKAAAKRAVLERYGLPVNGRTMERPLVGMISRMVDQKGFDLLAALADDLPRVDATFVVLGTGETRYQDLWKDLAARERDRIGAHIGFDEALAHLIEGGADIFLMPSHFEPCGLNQMYSMRYGTVPVVHAVGGLADTVRDYTEAAEPLTAAAPGGRTVNPRPRTAADHKDVGTGFVFREYRPDALMAALARALELFADRNAWRMVQAAGMREDNSWNRSAGEYVKIYKRALAHPTRRT